MNRFYFTYGSGGQPFHGGWTEVVAPNMKTACGAFQAFHPNVYKDCLNCCCVYTEEDFKKTCMYENGNLGSRCHEVITLTREACGGAA